MEENKFWEMMDRLSDILQILNYQMLLKDASNSDLLRYLQHQDNDLLSIIVSQNEEIIKLLKKGENNGDRTNL